jgi:hypothetical protein
MYIWATITVKGARPYLTVKNTLCYGEELVPCYRRKGFEVFTIGMKCL